MAVLLEAAAAGEPLHLLPGYARDRVEVASQDELVCLYETLPAVGDTAAAMPRARVSEVRGQPEARVDA